MVEEEEEDKNVVLIEEAFWTKEVIIILSVRRYFRPTPRVCFSIYARARSMSEAMDYEYARVLRADRKKGKRA